MGRAARHAEGHVILYADQMSVAMKEAIEEVQRRRQVQQAFNTKHGITPQTIAKPIREQLVKRVKEDGPKYRSLSQALVEEPRQDKETGQTLKPIWVELSKNERVDLNFINADELLPEQQKDLAKKLRRAMKRAADEMDFELAALIRDAIRKLE